MFQLSIKEKYQSTNVYSFNHKQFTGNETKLKIYALFKQATAGPVTTKRPGMMDFVGRAKWDAWNALGSMTPEEAQKTYIELVNSLVGEEVSVVSFMLCWKRKILKGSELAREKSIFIFFKTHI